MRCRLTGLRDMTMFICRSQRLYIDPEVRESRSVGSLSCSKEGVSSVAFDSSGRFFLAACGKVVRLFSSSGGLLIQTFVDAGGGYDVTTIAPADDGNRFASCAGKHCLLWDVATAQTIRKFSGHEERVNAVCHLDNVLATGSYDRAVRLFDLRSSAGAPCQVILGAKDSVSGLLWHSGAYQLTSTSIDGCVRSYDCRKGLLDVDDLGAPVTSLSPTRDGECLLCSCLGGKLMLIDKETGELLASYTGHTNREYRLECGVLHDDGAVASGSEDGSLFIWDLTGGAPPFKTTSRDSSPMSALALHPAKGWALAGHHSGRLEMFEIQSRSG